MRCSCGWLVVAPIKMTINCPKCGATLEIHAAGVVKCYEEWPKWARIIRKFKSPKDTGVGDTFARLTKTLGIDRVAKFIGKYTKGCRCDERQAIWNMRFPYE